MRQVIFLTINSLMGLPPVKHLILSRFFKSDTRILVIHSEIQNFENFFTLDDIKTKSLIIFKNSISFNRQNIFLKIFKYLKLFWLFCISYLFSFKRGFQIYTFDIFSTVLAVLLKKRSSTIIYIQYEMIEPDLLNRLDRFFFSFMIKKSKKIDLVITPEANRTEYIKKLLRNSSASHFFTLPNSNNNDIEPIKEDSIEQERPIIITHIGAVGLNHHITSYLDAITQLDQNKYEFRFIGLLTEDVKALIKNYNRSNIKLTGQIKHNELHSYYLQTDIGVILYKNVSLNHRYCAPNKLYEYWSYGIPVIGDELPGLQSVFTDECLGCLVNMTNSKAISQGITLLGVKRRKEQTQQYFNNNYKLDNYLHLLKGKLEALEK